MSLIRSNTSLGTSRRQRAAIASMVAALAVAAMVFVQLAGGAARPASAGAVIPHAYSGGAVSMTIQGINGDGTSRGPTAIDVLSWSWGVSNPHTTTTGGAGAGKASFSSFSIMKQYDKTSPLLALAVAKKTVLKSVVIYLDPRVAAGDSSTITLSNVVIQNVEHSGAGGEGAQESVSFTYQKITWTYYDQKTGSNFKGGWDLAKGTKI